MVDPNLPSSPPPSQPPPPPPEEQSSDRRSLVGIMLQLTGVIVICGLIAAGLFFMNSTGLIDLGNVGDFSDFSLGEATELPAPPTDLGADGVTIYDIFVDWNDASNNEDGFYIYRRRLDILSELTRVGESGRNVEDFDDLETNCGATYQYVLSSYNNIGESPTTVCWQITLPACPATRTMRLKFGAEFGRNFATGALGDTASFYALLTEDGVKFMADGNGMQGLIDMGDIGTTALHQVNLPDSPDYQKAGLLAVPGHTYVSLTRDGRGWILFTVSKFGDPLILEYIIVYPNDLIAVGECMGLGTSTGGECVSGDGVCDPTCVTSNRGGTRVPDDERRKPDADIYETPFESGYIDGIQVVSWAGSAPGQESEIDGYAGATPPLPDYPEWTFTERDYDCTNTTCISGDDVCNPECATSDTYQGWESGIEFPGFEGMPSPGADNTTPDNTSRHTDRDCGPPCVTGDGVCDPTCSPNVDDRGRSGDDGVYCYDTDGSGQPDTCYTDPSRANEVQPISYSGQSEIPQTTGTSRTDGDCTGPCDPTDGVCTPYCDPYFDPEMPYQTGTPPTTDPDCGPGGDQPGCACRGSDLYCDNQLEESNSSQCSSGGSGTCGDGTCNTATENSDLCPADCSCVDDGVCSPGEGSNCRDCGETAGSCNNPCTDSSQCGEGLTCAGGVCYDACTCGGDCGNTDPGGGDGVKCECDGTDLYCDDGSYSYGHASCAGTQPISYPADGFGAAESAGIPFSPTTVGVSASILALVSYLTFLIFSRQQA